MDVAQARVLAPLTFLIILGTVLIQGGTAKWLANRLGVSEADPQGFLLMGANLLTQELGLMLQKEGFMLRLIDANHINVRQARHARTGRHSGQHAFRFHGNDD